MGKSTLLPLYSGHNAPVNYRNDFNAGLWYDKFCNQWNRDGKKWFLETGKNLWIKQISEKKTGSGALLEEFVDRLGRMAVALRGEARYFATGWRFVTGLGREHPVENGFAWHQVLGVPYLPGSSVKGAVRAWAEQWAEYSDDEVRRIFGPPGTASELSVGRVIFFDALPVGPVKVQADVITPHYAPYYQSQGPAQPPGDWFEPVPIPFLTVAPGQTFLFTIAPRRPDSQDDRRDCAMALQWLEEALAGIGAGAKTAAGYGRFARQPDMEKKLIERWVIQQVEDKRGESRHEEPAEFPAEPVNPILVEMEEDGYSSNPERFMLALTTKWLARMQNAETEAACRRKIAGFLAAWYQKAKPDQWKKPNKKNAPKIAAIKAAMEES